MHAASVCRSVLPTCISDDQPDQAAHSVRLCSKSLFLELLTLPVLFSTLLLELCQLAAVSSDLPLQYLYSAGLCAHADRDTLLRRRDMLVRASNIIHHGFDCQSNAALSASGHSLQPRSSSVDRLLVPANMRPLCTITEGSEARWMLANASRVNSSIALTGSRANSAALDPFVLAMEQVLAQMVGQATFDHPGLDRQVYMFWCVQKRVDDAGRSGRE